MKPEVVAFLDTNYCLHYDAPEKSDWPTLLGAERVRLVACLGLIDELDDKKTHPTLNGRASKWIKRIKEFMRAPKVVRPNVTIEVFASAAALSSQSLSKGDAAIVEQTKEFMVQAPAATVVVISEDGGMLARCLAQQIEVVEPDHAFRLDDPVSDLQKRNAEQTRELLAIKNARPDLKLLVSMGDEQTDSNGPLHVTLTKGNTGHFHEELSKWLRVPIVSESFNLGGAGDDRMSRAVDWCNTQEKVLDESRGCASLP